MAAGLALLLAERKIDLKEAVTQLLDFAGNLESDQTQAHDALAAKVAEWKSRAEKAEAALKAMEEDDRHLCRP